MLRKYLCLLYKYGLKEKSQDILTGASAYFNSRKYSTNLEINPPKVYVNNDVDTFGTLSTSECVNEEITDQGDLSEEKFLEESSLNNKKLTTKQYADIIKLYIRKRQIKEAIDVVEIKMIKEDHVKPENYIFNLLLGACGRVGYTKKAFHLFNQMKKRGLKPTGGTYTALFNACANSPWPEDGLSRAQKLRDLMIEKGVCPNETTYNSMIKAFGRCGDIQAAFGILDEMMQNNIPLKTEAVNFLLQACITNKEAGFLHALLVWRKFNQSKICPDIYSFNLMLHCVRECSIGDPEVAKTLLENSKFHIGENISLTEYKDIKQIIISNSEEMKNKQNENLQLSSGVSHLLAEMPSLGNMIQLTELKTQSDRLLLIGGSSGFLKNMQKYNIKPDIKTFAMLLDNMPSTKAAEESLLSKMKKSNVKPDIDFLNMLIKKRSMRCDYTGAKEVLDLFDKYKYKPNIFTYGVLALGCETIEESRILLREISNCGYRINIEILGALIKNACVRQNFVYVLEIMELVVKEKIMPNKSFLEHIKIFHKQCKEQEKTTKKNKSWKRGFEIFRMRYKSWLEEIQPDEIENIHPWEQFRTPVETKVKNYKDPSVYFKPRITSRFKQKTGTLK